MQSARLSTRETCGSCGGGERTQPTTRLARESREKKKARQQQLLSLASYVTSHEAHGLFSCSCCVRVCFCCWRGERRCRWRPLAVKREERKNSQLIARLLLLLLLLKLGFDSNVQLLRNSAFGSSQRSAVQRNATQPSTATQAASDDSKSKIASSSSCWRRLRNGNRLLRSRRSHCRIRSQSQCLRGHSVAKLVLFLFLSSRPRRAPLRKFLN